MEASIIVAGAAVGGNILLAIGLGATWIRNGRSQANKYGALETEVRNTGEKVDTLTVTVTSLDNSVDKFKTHCAGVSGRIDERVKATERDIHEIKAK